MDWHVTDFPQALRKFKALSELMFTGSLADKEEEIKVKYLLIWAGEEAIELVSTWNLSADDTKQLELYWIRFEQYAAPKSNFRLARFKLRSYTQGTNDIIDAFTKPIRLLVSEYKHADPNEQISDAI